MLDRLVARCRCRGRRRRGCRELARRDRDARARAADEDRASASPSRTASAAQPGRVRVVDRVGGATCRGRSPRGRAATRLQHERLQREPRVVERAGDPHEPLSFARACVATPGRRSAPRPARRRAARGARSGSWCWCPARARRGGTRAARPGSSRRSPARETPPPITTSSGSNVLIALAMPIPSRSPSTRRQHCEASSPRFAPSTTSWPGDLAFARQQLAEERVPVLRRAVVGQPVQRAAGGERLQRAALRERRPGGGVAVASGRAR